MTLYNLSVDKLKNILESYNREKTFEQIFNDYAYREWQKFKLYDFPYPTLNSKSCITELKKLRELVIQETDTASNFVKKQSVIIRGFHHSRYRGNYGFQKDANKPCENSCLKYWEEMKNDFNIFKKVYLIVLKRCICNAKTFYSGNYEPIQRGEVSDAGIYWLAIYFCKPCALLGYFKPQLAKYIITKYLSNFEIIRDPFSGYSGRMLGAWSLDKTYIGSDLNDEVIIESTRIIDFISCLDTRKKLSNSTPFITPEIKIFQDDVLNSALSPIDEQLRSNVKPVALLTCSPYEDKEVYNRETTFLSCEEWIDRCLVKFNYISNYVFVCNSTILDSKYSKYIVESIRNISPLAYKNSVDLNDRRRSEYILKITR